MPIIDVDLSGAQEPKPLDNGRYTVRVTEAKKYLKEDTGKQSLGLQMTVIDGQTQRDGSDAEDRRLSDFFPLNGFAEMKDGGKFVQAKIASMLNAAGVSSDDETEDLVGTEFDVVVRTKRDQDGIEVNDIRHYRKVGE